MNEVSNLRLVSQAGTQYTFAWDLPTDSHPDFMFFDVSLDPGFVSFVKQDLLPNVAVSHSVSLQPDVYYIRVNAHYPNMMSGVYDRGWFPSDTYKLAIPGGPVFTTGTPATSLSWNPQNNSISWAIGTGPITRQALDLSDFSNFGDILTAPFIPPLFGGVYVDKLPFSVDMNPTTSSVILNNLPLGTEFFARVNTLFNNRIWEPSDKILHFHTDGSVTLESAGGGFPVVLLLIPAALVIWGLLRR